MRQAGIREVDVPIVGAREHYGRFLERAAKNPRLTECRFPTWEDLEPHQRDWWTTAVIIRERLV